VSCRAKFEQLVKSLLDRTVQPCMSCMKDAGVQPTDIQEVLMVGGMSRMPKVSGRPGLAVVALAVVAAASVDGAGVDGAGVRCVVPGVQCRVCGLRHSRWHDGFRDGACQTAGWYFATLLCLLLCASVCVSGNEDT
jgi:hypothetical protein